MGKQLIPELRFSKYEGKWDFKLLKSITKIKAGGTPSTVKRDYWNGEILWMNSGELNLKRIFDVENRITQKGLKNSSTHLIPKECILIGLAGQGKTRGTAAINYVELCTNQSIASVYPNKNVFNSEFLYQNIDSRYDELRNLSTGAGGRGGLNLQIIGSFKVPVPSLPEQQKIAAFLTDVDDKITKLTKKKNLLEQYKKGIMQKIFNQELRFKDDNGNNYPIWVEKKLGKISNITTGSSNRQDSGLDGEYTFFDRSEDIRTSSRYLFDGDAVIVAGEGSDFIPKYYVGKFDLHQRTYAIMEFKDSISKFIYFYIHFHRRYFLSQAVGSTVKSLRLPMFQKMPVKLPVKEEQTKIANFLSDIDLKIEALNNKIENSKTFKKGLLQKMFV